MSEGAFNMVQATKPQSLAFALHDSPVGLAAWILSMMTSGSSDNLEERFTLDELITNIMLYWITEAAASSMRVYAENARAAYGEPATLPQSGRLVKAGVIHMPYDAPLPREWAERRINVVRFSEMPAGGHFPAWEVPDAYERIRTKRAARLAANIRRQHEPQPHRSRPSNRTRSRLGHRTELSRADRGRVAKRDRA